MIELITRYILFNYRYYLYEKKKSIDTTVTAFTFKLSMSIKNYDELLSSGLGLEFT